MSSSTGGTLPYKSRIDFLDRGIDDVLLDAAFDCSICREPLAIILGNNDRSLSPAPFSRLTSLPHVAVNEDMPLVGGNAQDISVRDITTTTSTDEVLVPESAARIPLCNHIFGRDCLTAWFTSSKSNRCPECNQELFPNRYMLLTLREPTRSMRMEFANYIEGACGDPETAEVIRNDLMSDWTRLLIREFACELLRQQGYEVDYQYVGGEAAEEEDDVDEDTIVEDEANDVNNDELEHGGGGDEEQGVSLSEA